MSIITKDIGRVSIVPKGTWNSNNTYTRLDLVSYNGSSYIAKQNVPVNTNLNNADYWKLVAEKGDIGISISGVRKTGTSVLTDTYTIDFTDGTNTTFEIGNGNGILNITKTGTSGIVDTYTITFTNGTSTTFNVTNGSDIASITKTGTSADGLVDTYTVTLTNDETHTFVVRNGNGITSVTKTGTSANRLTDTYTITFEDGTSTTFNVNHGVGILSITGPVSSGLTDTYTINFADGTNTTFDVQNARSISSITRVDVTGAAGHTDTYDINFNDNSTPFRLEIYNGQNGEGSASTVDEVQADGEGNVPLLIFGNTPPTTSTVGQLKQRYYDRTNEILYICTGIDTSGAQAVYTWQATGVSVDNQLDGTSENPVQNKVLTAKVGTSTLQTTNKNLSDAINELNTLEQGNANKKDIASTISGTQSAEHLVGDYGYYGSVLYKCITTYTGMWDSSKWEEVKISDEIITKAPVGLGITNASVGKVPVIKTVDANGVPTSYEFGDLDGKYVKPPTGIPKTDLANDVQTSLGKADTALQAGALPTGGADGDVLVKNGSTDYAATWKKTPPQMGSLATIEPTSSASKAYAAGDYLVYNGQLYKVIKTISPQDALDSGTNGNIQLPNNGGFNDVSKYTEITGVQTDVDFQLPIYAREVLVDCAFTEGQHISLYSAFPASGQTRCDSGFYYFSNKYGGGAVILYADRRIHVGKPWYGGQEVAQYASIRCFYR